MCGRGWGGGRGTQGEAGVHMGRQGYTGGGESVKSRRRGMEERGQTLKGVVRGGLGHR